MAYPTNNMDWTRMYQNSNPLGQHSNHLGQYSNPLGQHSNHFGQHGNPLGQQPFMHPQMMGGTYFYGPDMSYAPMAGVRAGGSYDYDAAIRARNSYGDLNEGGNDTTARVGGRMQKKRSKSRSKRRSSSHSRRRSHRRSSSGSRTKKRSSSSGRRRRSSSGSGSRSRRSSSSSRSHNPWIRALAKARAQLGIKGFTPVRRGTSLYNLAMRYKNGG